MLSEAQSVPVMRLDRVNKYYKRGSESVTALEDVSFALESGSVVVILGPSGGGKSTLLHILGGMDRPSSGQVLVLGEDIGTWGSDQLARYRRQVVGFVFQSFHLIPSMTALENVELPLLMAGVPRAERHNRALALLDRVGLQDRATHYPGELSGGQAQRVAIARALASNPPLILADEPTGNLDSASGAEIMDLLSSLAHEDGHSVVIVTHNDDAVALADRVLRMRDGHLQEEPRSPAKVSRVNSAPRNLGHVKWPALFALSWHSLTRRMARGTLTGLGIAIGVAAMVLLIGLGSGLKSHVVNGIVSLGPLTAINVSPGSGVSGSGGLLGPQVVSGPSRSITAHTLKEFAKLPGSRGAYANVTFLAGATWHGRSTTIALLPMPPRALWSVSGILPSLTAGYPSALSNHIILPTSVADALLGGKDPSARTLIGQVVSVHLETLSGGLFTSGGLSGPARRIPPVRATITGIISSGFGYAPYTNIMGWTRSFSSNRHHVTYAGATVLAQTLNGVKALASKIEEMGYSTTTLSQALKSISNSFSLIEVGLGAIGGIALIVAGLMIGVVMSMSVLERRREIGVFRAIGARRRDISRLFLLEAMLIGLTGALVGIGVGAGAGTLINHLVQHSANGKDGIFALPLWLAGLGLAFGIGVSVIAGAIPAAHAASLNPVDALRQE